jgi:tRNA pseudouridine(54/55) synthase
MMGSHPCRTCRKYLGVENDGETTGCPVCLGLWQCRQRLHEALQQACEPYGGVSTNRFASSITTIMLPGDIALRYHAASTSKNLPFSKFQQDLKDHLRSILTDYIQTYQIAKLASEYPSCIEQEEQGHLCVHLLIVPPKDIQRPPDFILRRTKRSNRKRFRGNDPTEKQGGDPLVNRQEQLTRQGYDLWNINEVEASLERGNQQSLSLWFQQLSSDLTGDSELHVIVWRRPFYVRALYTKARRDVSQTPFYVPQKVNNKTVMSRLGVTSVEEQIVPPLQVACGGISKLNNNGNERDDVVFGMIKFHASGREDMNVRMMLPPEPTANVGGRPFVCQVVDALRFPSTSDLHTVVQAINQGRGDERTYGRNPMGVGISSCLQFVPSASFKNLQADTEEKIKYYGCFCWSEKPIPSEDYLNQTLAAPIELQQQTPIRVVHRRPNMVRTRRVLSLKATKVDDHFFRLNISTDAGCYVKEFVHGDLGRTLPSVSSLLECKTDILELDCEGIQQDITS